MIGINFGIMVSISVAEPEQWERGRASFDYSFLWLVLSISGRGGKAFLPYPTSRSSYWVLLLPTYVVCGKVVFSVMSVCLSPQGGGPHVMTADLCKFVHLQTGQSQPYPQTCSKLFTCNPHSYWWVGGWFLTERPSCCSIKSCRNLRSVSWLASHETKPTCLWFWRHF